MTLPDLTPGMNKKDPGPIEPPDKSRGDVDADRSSESDRKILRLALKRFKKCVEAENENRGKALEDLKFKAGDQWPQSIRTERENDKRPCLTANTIPTLTHQITNDIRQNRPAITISPIGDKTDKEAAQLFAGMIRAIERECAADIAYDTAITSAADIGFGYWRILTEYEDENSFNQNIVIRRVRNSFTVYLDPMRQEPDGCDAQFGFVSEMMPRDEFEDQYPDADPVSWTEKGVGDDLKEWVTKDAVRVAEYFTVEREPAKLVQLSNGHIGIYEELDSETLDAIKSGELEIISERQTDQQKVVWYKLTGHEILEKKPWPGKWIPIVEVVGEEIDLQGKVIRSGVIRNVKDAQRMKNFWLSYKTEIVALAPKSPYIGAEGQFEGYEGQWKMANRRSLPYLEYVPVSLDGNPVPPPQRQPPSGVPAGVVEAEQSAERDMMATSGVRFNATINERINDESGLAIREIRRNNDIGSFHYMDNASRSLRHTGRILVDLIPKVYDTRRVVTILREDDTEQRVTLDPMQAQPLQRQQNARQEPAQLLFNPGVGKYGVTVTVGPSYATKRIEAQEQMMRFAAAMPQKGQLIAHLIAKYSDWPGSDEIYKLLLKTLPPQLLTPDIKDLPPQMQQFVQSLMQQIGQLMAERVQMLKDLTDNRTDQATKRLKVDRDFEAKVLATLATLKTKMMDFDRQDIQTAVGLSNAYPQGFPSGIADPLAPPGQPGVPGMEQSMGQIPGMNPMGQIPPNMQALPISR